MAITVPEERWEVGCFRVAEPVRYAEPPWWSSPAISVGQETQPQDTPWLMMATSMVINVS